MNIYHQSIWRRCTRYNNYEVSNNGGVRNIVLNKPMKECKSDGRRGLAQVCLKKDGKMIREYIQDLMEEEFTDEEIRGEDE